MKTIKGISFLYNKEIGYLEIIEEKDGKLGGYSGGEGGNKGIEIKKYLLELEKNFK